MTDRWSNPSGGLGIHRFRVWPAGSDSYSHSDLFTNFDTLDAILGTPSDASTWPPTQGIDGGIYKEVRLLQLDRAPIGVVTPWFRPTSGVPIPTGWLVCDGSTVLAADHDFPGVATSIVLPDLRNRFVLGADDQKALNTAAVDVGNGDIDTANGAPGGSATGGSNQHTLIQAEIPAFTATTSGPSIGMMEASPDPTNIGVSPGVYGPPGNWDFTPRTHHTHTIAISGGDQPHENRPRWLGLIYLCKVKFADSV